MSVLSSETGLWCVYHKYRLGAEEDVMDFDLQWPSEKYICSYRLPANTLVKTIVEQLEAGCIDGVAAIGDDAAVQRYELAGMSFDATDDDWKESFIARDSPLEDWILPGGAIFTLVPLRRGTPT